MRCWQFLQSRTMPQQWQPLKIRESNKASRWPPCFGILLSKGIAKLTGFSKIMESISRRTMIPLVGTALSTTMSLHAQSSKLTARQVIERIQKNIGVPWREKTVDTFKTGDPDTPVTGIATSFMSTFDVLKRAAASGKNLVITHEPTFWNHEDKTSDFSNDPVFQAKHEFIEKNKIVIFRFHDHWHMRRPDGIQMGIIENLGWEKYRAGESTRQFVLPETTLSTLAKYLQQKTKARAVRIIGNPQLQIRNVSLEAGSTTLQGIIRPLQQSDVVIAGEVREWEGVEYIQDAITSGAKKALIILGHAPSEDPGMTYCAKWLKTFISEVPVEAVPAGDPFWTIHA